MHLSLSLVELPVIFVMKNKSIFFFWKLTSFYWLFFRVVVAIWKLAFFKAVATELPVDH